MHRRWHSQWSGWFWVRLGLYAALAAGIIFSLYPWLTSGKNASEAWGFKDATVKDILNIAAIPLAGSLIAFVVSRSHTADEQRVAADREQETAMQTYIDSMSNLLLTHNLREGRDDAEERILARVLTLTTLQRLNGARKGTVVRFLSEAGLIAKRVGEDGTERDAIIRLTGANLAGAELTGMNLSGQNMAKADLTNAHMDRASLSSANLAGAILKGAHVSGARAFHVDLTQAQLQGATLRGSVLGDGKLGSADLSGADLRGTNLNLAHLGMANFTKARYDKKTQGLSDSVKATMRRSW